MKKEKTMLEIAKEKKKGYSFVDDGKGVTIKNDKNSNRKTNK